MLGVEPLRSATWEIDTGARETPELMLVRGSRAEGAPDAIPAWTAAAPGNVPDGATTVAWCEVGTSSDFRGGSDFGKVDRACQLSQLAPMHAANSESHACCRHPKSPPH